MSVVSGNAATGSTWYVRGDFNNWSRNENYKMTAEGNGVFALSNVAIGAGQGFKVENGEKNEWAEAYPGSNYVVNTAGNYTIRFDTNTDTVSLDGVAPDYYLIGSMNNWTQNDANYKMTKNASSAANEYVLKDVALTTTTEFKGFSNGNYYPGGYDNNYGQHGEITENGIYNVYLRPDGDGGDGWFYNCLYVEKATKITGHSLSLKDEIAVNFYAYVPAAYQNVTATYSYGTGDYKKEGLAATVTAADPTENNGANLKISCPVNARSMTDTVTVTLKAGNDTLLTNSYRVVDYSEDAAAVYANNINLKNLLCAMLEYGGAVQKYFKYNESDYADAAAYIQKINPNWQSPAAPVELDDYYTDIATIGTNTDLNARFLGSVLSATGKTTVRLYFDFDEPELYDGTYDHEDDPDYDPSLSPDEPNPIFIYLDGVKLTVKKSNVESRGYYVDIPLSASNIFEDFILDFSGGSAYTYNAAHYYNFAMDDANAAKFESVRDALQKMYVYYDCATKV